MSRHTLSQRLNRTMVGSTAATMLVSFVFLFAAYFLLYRFAPRLAPSEDAVLPNAAELGIFAVCLLFGSISSSFVATALARRMVEPLSAVAQAARAITAGDLSARATLTAPAPTEPTQLVADFNAMADRLQRAVDDIVTWNSVIAHELRTPVAILKGRLQGLSEGVFEPEPALLSSLRQQADGLARLVEDLRVVSLLDSGQLQLQPVDIDLAAEIESLARLVENDLDKAGFGLRMTLTSGRCVADPIRLRQAIMALIDNALKYAEPCTLELETVILSQTVTISVIDGGPGMPDNFVDRAFEPFRRADSTSRTRHGSGLGLAVVRGIAQAHGGSVSYERVGGRSAFTLTIPR